MVGRQKPISAVDGASGAAAGRAPGAQLRTALSDGVEFLAGQAPLAVRRVIGGAFVLATVAKAEPRPIGPLRQRLLLQSAVASNAWLPLRSSQPPSGVARFCARSRCAARWRRRSGMLFPVASCWRSYRSDAIAAFINLSFSHHTCVTKSSFSPCMTTERSHKICAYIQSASMCGLMHADAIGCNSRVED